MYFIALPLSHRAAVVFRERLLAQWPGRPELRSDFRAPLSGYAYWIASGLAVAFFVVATGFDVLLVVELGLCVAVAAGWTVQRAAEMRRVLPEYARRRGLPVPTPMPGAAAGFYAAYFAQMLAWLLAACFLARVLVDLYR